MFAAPVALRQNPGAGKESKRHDGGLPCPPTSVNLSVQLMPQAPEQKEQTTSKTSQSSSSGKKPRRFCLYFIFEDIKKESKWRFMKFALQILSPTCTVSQQKSAWAYLLYYIMAMKDESEFPSQVPCVAMGDCMKKIYFERFNSTLLANGKFPLLISLTVLDSATPIEGFDIPDPFHGVFSIIEHFKMNVIEAVKVKEGTGVSLVMPPQEPSTMTTAQAEHRPLLAGPQAGVLQVQGAQKNLTSTSLSSTSTSTSVQHGTRPWNFINYKPPDTDVLSISSGSTIGNQEENTINLDDYNESIDSAVRVEDVAKPQLILSSQALPFNVVPIQGLLQYHNGQLVTTNGLPVLQLKAPNSAAIGQQLNNNALQDIVLSHIPALNHQASSKPQLIVPTPAINQQKKKPAANQTSLQASTSGAPPALKQVEPRENRGTIRYIESGAGQQQPRVANNMSRKHPLDVRASRNRKKTKSSASLGPTLKKDDLDKRESSAQQKALYVQGTNEVIILEDATQPESSSSSKTSSSSNLCGRISPQLEAELSALRAVVPRKVPRKRGVKPQTKHLSLFDSSILRDTGDQKVNIQLSSNPSPQTPPPSTHQALTYVARTEQDLSKLTKKEKLMKEEEEDTKEPVKAAPRSSKIKDLVGVGKDALADQAAGQRKIRELITVGGDSASQGAGQNKIKDLIGLSKASVERATPKSSNDTVAQADHTDHKQLYTVTVKEESPMDLSSRKPLSTEATATRKASPKPLAMFKKVVSVMEQKSSGEKRPATDDIDAPQGKVIKLEEDQTHSAANSGVNSPVQHVKNSPVKHIPSILGGRKTVLESDEGSKRMTGSNRWKFSKQRVHVSKREVSIESPAQHDLRIQPEPMPRRKLGNRRKPRNQERTVVLISDDEESDQEEELKPKLKPKSKPILKVTSEEKPRVTRATPTVKELIAKARLKNKAEENSAETVGVKATQKGAEQKPVAKETDNNPKEATPDKFTHKGKEEKAKPQPSVPREETVGKKVYMWVPMKRRFGIMSRSTVDKDGNKVYKSKVKTKTNKFFSISKKRMMDLGLKGNEGRPLSPNSEMQNRLKALCKTMKPADLVDRSCEKSAFLSAFGLISTAKLETACSEISEGRTSRKRQIKAPSRYDL